MQERSFFQDILTNLLDRKSIFKSFLRKRDSNDNFSTEELINNMQNAKGEASAAVNAEFLFQNIETLNDEKRLNFFHLLARKYDINGETLLSAIKDFNKNSSPENLDKVIDFSEPKRKELFRRLNSSERGTIRLVKLREKLIDIVKDNPDLKRVDNDFLKLFKSWFNPGFLVLKPVDWTTSAHILEKIIKYEAVHEIKSWKDLRDRLEPSDRRCFAFFHPAMQDEPLIFVEVALMESNPHKIEEVLSSERKKVKRGDEKSAIFYSISNCQRGLKGVSFGNFLIKQVANQIKLEFPNIKNFVTLSPVPGFMKWVKGNSVSLYENIQKRKFNDELNDLQSDIIFSSIDYFSKSLRNDGLPNDPVARFHLGNGAVLDRINFAADKTEKAFIQSTGLMVNYKYDLDNIERNHEEYFRTKVVLSSSKVKELGKELSKNKN